MFKPALVVSFIDDVCSCFWQLLYVFLLFLKVCRLFGFLCNKTLQKYASHLTVVLRHNGHTHTYTRARAHTQGGKLCTH